MAALTLAQLRTATGILVGDASMTTFDATMYKDAINFAIKNYATKTGATYLEANVTPDASGFCVIPTGYIRLQRVSYKIGGTTTMELTESTFSFESMKSSTWQLATATDPKRWVLWSGAKVKITPIPTVIYAATIGYIEYPVDLALDGDVVDARIPIVHQEYLKYATASWLLLLDGDGQSIGMADNLMEKFNSLIGYSDPVLELKLKQTRTKGDREV